MAEEPAPENPPPTGPTEDLKTTAALSHLSAAPADDDVSNQDANDTAALSNAVSNLHVEDAVGKGSAGELRMEDAKAKKVKIDPADVAFLVDELEVTKSRATDMLRASKGERGSAVRAFMASGR